MTSSICPTASSAERRRSRSCNDKRLTATAFEGGVPRSISSVCCASKRSINVSWATISASRSPAAPMPSALTPASRARVERSHHMVTNRERAGHGHDAEQPDLLQIHPPLAGSEPAKKSETAFTTSGGLRQKLGKAELAASGIERVAPDCRAQTAVTVHREHVEEDIHRQQRLRARSADPIGQTCSKAGAPATLPSSI